MLYKTLHGWCEGAYLGLQIMSMQIMILLMSMQIRSRELGVGLIIGFTLPL